MDEPITQIPVWRYSRVQLAAATDKVAVEEPLEIRLMGSPSRY